MRALTGRPTLYQPANRLENLLRAADAVTIDSVTVVNLRETIMAYRQVHFVARHQLPRRVGDDRAVCGELQS